MKMSCTDLSEQKSEMVKYIAVFIYSYVINNHWFLYRFQL